MSDGFTQKNWIGGWVGGFSSIQFFCVIFGIFLTLKSPLGWKVHCICCVTRGREGGKGGERGEGGDGGEGGEVGEGEE